MDVMTRCPRCAYRQVVAPEVVGQVVGCYRCEHTFQAVPLTAAGRVRDLLMAAAALAVGAGVCWLLLRNGAFAH